MLWALGISLAQFVPAFVVLDLFFRWMPVAPDQLGQWFGRHALLYGLLSVLFSALGAFGQWRLAGAVGLAVGLLNAVPWWLLWRFGLRKQLTFLYKSDGGRDRS
jgi:hypothetical protein